MSTRHAHLAGPAFALQSGDDPDEGVPWDRLPSAEREDEWTGAGALPDREDSLPLAAATAVLGLLFLVAAWFG